MLVAVGSGNPVKLVAAQAGFTRIFAEFSFTFERCTVSSGVSDQPMTQGEALAGAENRARAALAATPGAAYGVGIEGGVEETPSGLCASAWIAVCDPTQVRHGATARFMLPSRVAELVRGGMELGAADDLVFARKDSKRKEGAIGLLSRGALDRAGLYEQGVIMALLPFRSPDVYGPGS